MTNRRLLQLRTFEVLFVLGFVLVLSGCQQNPNDDVIACPPPLELSAKLKRNQAIWNENKPDAYRFRYRNPSSGVRTDSWLEQELSITVIQNRTVSVKRLDANEYHWDPESFPNIDTLFENVAAAIEDDQDVEIKFDPKYGFPSFVDVGEIEADSGYQILLTQFEGLTIEQARKQLPNKSELASPDDKYQGLLKFPKPEPKNMIDWLETQRAKRNGLVCIWDVKSGKPIFYGGKGDRGNDVEIAASGNRLAIFEPATREKYGLKLYELEKGFLFGDVSWSRPFVEFVGGRLSHDGEHYVSVQSASRVPVKAKGFTTSWHTEKGELRLINARTGEDKWKVPLSQQMQFGADCKFSNDEKVFGVSYIPPNGASHVLKDKQVIFHTTIDGKVIRKCPGELLTFSTDGKQAIIRRVFDEAPTYRLIQLDLESGKEKELRSSPYESFRFAFFNSKGELLVDISAHRRSSQLYIERLPVDSAQSIGEVKLPALNFNEKFSVSPDGTVFARLTRNGTAECRIEIYKLSDGELIQTLNFQNKNPQNKGHMIGDLILLDSLRIATSHPLVIWRD